MESRDDSNLEDEGEIDPIGDIIDYLVRSARISFKNSHLNGIDVKTTDKIKAACKLYNESPTNFLLEFGKYLSPNHLQYFENIQQMENHSFRECLRQLKQYHSYECTHKRIRNRRFKALSKLKAETDYFSDKQMMYRNPLLYEQLVGQYLTNEEIQARDAVENNRSFLNLILETVDRHELEEIKNKQAILEDNDSSQGESKMHTSNKNVHNEKRWGEFDEPETEVTFAPRRKEALIDANERNLLREEFLQEMYSSFIEGRDVEFDYSTVDNNEDYDDLDQISQDAEDKYFDSEQNEVENLEEHMKLVEEYGRKQSDDCDIDPLDIFMQHISNKLSQCYV